MKLKIKPSLIPICVNYFLLYITNGFAFPYVSLHMRTLGLSMDDVAFIFGLVPFIAFILTPLVGYAGDKLGYKMVMVFSILLTAATIVSLIFLPPYREHFNKIAVDTNFNSSIDINNIIWFGKYAVEGFNCTDTAVNISRIECDGITYDVDLHLDVTNAFDTTIHECNDLDRSSCKFVFKENASMENVIVCSVISGTDDDRIEQGSHNLTLWLYFMLFTIYKIISNAYYNLSDATASTLAKKERSSISMIMLFGHIGALIPQFTIGPLVDNVNIGASYTDCITDQWVILKDYMTPFLISGGIMVLMGIFIFFFLEVEIPKPQKLESIAWWKEFSWISNPAVIAFYIQMLMFGFYWGGEDTFFFIYVTEELFSSTAFTGYTDACKTAIRILMMPFAKPIIEKIGVVNTFSLGFLMVALRGIAFAFPFNSPPYEFLAYGLFDAIISLYGIAIIMYIGHIAPPQLTATAISIGCTVTWIVGKGVGAIVAGFLVKTFSIRIMLIVMGCIGSGFILLYWIGYHLILKKLEPGQKKENSNNDIVFREEEKDYSTISSGIFSTHL